MNVLKLVLEHQLQGQKTIFLFTTVLLNRGTDVSEIHKYIISFVFVLTLHCKHNYICLNPRTLKLKEKLAQRSFVSDRGGITLTNVHVLVLLLRVWPTK